MADPNKIEVPEHDFTSFMMEYKLIQKDVDNLSERIKGLEEQNKEMKELALSVQKLAINMEAMLKEQQDQGKRLSELEGEPAKKWNEVVKTLVTGIVGAFAGAIASGIMMTIAQSVIH